MALLCVDAATVDTIVLSYGRYDHFGGLAGLLATGRVQRGTPLFLSGEEGFCARVRGTEPGVPSFGALDRQALLHAGVVPVISSRPKTVADHGFTTGRIPFVSPELPRVPTAMLPGQGCDRALLDLAKRDACFVVDEAVHKLSTAYHIAGRGLLVIGSCSIINTVRRAQAVSGIDKNHAIIGGFRLVPPQTPEQAQQTVALMQALGQDVIIPGQCSGEIFVAAAQAAMPGKIIRSIVTTHYQFGRG